jgi:hypothetical protein
MRYHVLFTLGSWEFRFLVILEGASDQRPSGENIDATDREIPDLPCWMRH